MRISDWSSDVCSSDLRKRPMSENTVNAALRRMGFDSDTMTGHGFRAMARTILDEVLGFRPDFIEHQLAHAVRDRSEEHTSELQSLMRISYAVFCLKKKRKRNTITIQTHKQKIRIDPAKTKA